MKFKFVAAYCTFGMVMPTEMGTVPIFDGGNVRVFLTTNPNPHLAIIDRQFGIGRVMLSMAFGQVPDGDPKEAWKKLVADDLANRLQRFGSLYGYVVVEVEGDVEVEIREPVASHDGYSVCFDAYDRPALAERVQPHIASALSAVRLSGTGPIEFELVARGSYLIDDQGQVIHSISITGGGSATVGRSLSLDQIATMRELIVPLRAFSELEQSLDLHSQSLNRQESRLRAFMAAWNALEQFIKETKSQYGRLWDEERRNSTTSKERLEILNTIPDPTQKVARPFGKMACYLLSDEMQAGITELMELKEIRNGLSHELKDAELPVERVQNLMDKYLRAHLRFS